MLTERRHLKGTWGKAGRSCWRTSLDCREDKVLDAKGGRPMNAFIMQDKYLLNYILRSPARFTISEFSHFNVFFLRLDLLAKGKNQVTEPSYISRKEFC